MTANATGISYLYLRSMILSKECRTQGCRPSGKSKRTTCLLSVPLSCCARGTIRTL